MAFKKALFALLFVLTILIFYPQIISNINDVIRQRGEAPAEVTPQGENPLITLSVVKPSEDQKGIVPGRTPSLSSRLFKREERLNLFSYMERKEIIEGDNFLEYFSRDGFTLNLPIDRSLHLTTNLSLSNLKQGPKLRLEHRHKLAIFNGEVTLGFTGDYGLRFGLTKHF